MEIREINVSEIKAEACFSSAKFIENIGAVGIKVPVMLRKNGHGYVIVDGRADLLNVTRTQLKKHFRLLNFCKEALNKIKSGEMSGSIAFELSNLSKEAQKEIVSSGQITKEAVHERKVAKNLSSLASLIQVDEERDQLVLEFESLVAKISTGRALPEDIMKAIDMLRRFRKEFRKGGNDA